DFPADSLFKFAQEVYDLKGKRSIGSNSKFASLLKEKGDAHFWVNTGAMYGGSMPEMLSMISKINLLLEDNYTAATLNFEDGKIVLDTKNYYNKELVGLYKKFSSKNVNEALLKKIPSQNTAAVMAVSFPPEAIKAFVQLLGIDGLINIFLGKEGISIDDFAKA